MRVAAMLGLAAVLLACSCAYADIRPTVIELYTAEGCSSCPPAEALLGIVASRSNVIALALHVDYWDGDGWVDRYELRAATQRQNQYARTLGRSSVVTPEFVIDGARGFQGAQQAAEIFGAALGEFLHDGLAGIVGRTLEHQMFKQVGHASLAIFLHAAADLIGDIDRCGRLGFVRRQQDA